MKKRKKMCFTAIILIIGIISHSYASQGVAVQRIINNTRSELGQLATSAKASEIARLMKKFDTQYETWNASCGGADFDPQQPSDACKEMASQMRETGIKLYAELSEYLPGVAARYEQGALSAGKIVSSQAYNHTPSELYSETMNGISGVPKMEVGKKTVDDSPFNLEMDDFPDPTDEMFAVLEKLIPDFGKEVPEIVRAGNIQISMDKKAQKARYLSKMFAKAKFILESQREYGQIIFNATKAVSAMPDVLGIQYTGTRLSSKPNLKVLEYYKNKTNTGNDEKTEKSRIGGFAPRS